MYWKDIEMTEDQMKAAELFEFDKLNFDSIRSWYTTPELLRFKYALESLIQEGPSDANLGICYNLQEIIAEDDSTCCYIFISRITGTSFPIKGEKFKGSVWDGLEGTARYLLIYMLIKAVEMVLKEREK